jgi:hypothetical protein
MRWSWWGAVWTPGPHRSHRVSPGTASPGKGDEMADSLFGLWRGRAGMVMIVLKDLVLIHLH